MPYLIIAVIAVIVLYVLATYNAFATLKTRIRASIQEIGNQLKRQAALIPNLQNITKGYLEHEKKIFKEITEARKGVIEAVKSGAAQEMIDASDKFLKAIAPVRVILESTPQLQAQAPAMKFMDELRDTVDKVTYARRTLIDLSADYNIKLAVVPSGWVGKLFSFKPEKGLKTPETGAHVEVSEIETKTPEVKL